MVILKTKVDKKRICSAPRMKTQQEKDMINAKKKIRSLPENFFENILDLDLKLKINFSSQILEQMMHHLKIAIEYYENIGDPKYKDYQFMMEDLLTQPNVIKHLSDQDNEMLFKKGSGTFKKVKFEKNIQNNYMKNILLISDENELKVKEILKDAIKPIAENNVLNDDLQKQEDEFQKKLQERRLKKKGLSVDATYDTNQEGSLNFKFKRMNYSANIAFEGTTEISSSNNADLIIDDYTNRVEETPTGDKGEEETPTGESVNTEIITNEEKTPNHNATEASSIEIILNSNKIFPKHHRKNKSMFVLSDKVHDEFIPKGIGNNEVIQGIKDIIDIFLSEFNNYFHSNVFHKYTEHIQKLMDIKYKKYLEINNKYQAQIKEMELLLSNTEDSNDQHSESIKEIISELRKDQQNDINKNEENHQQLIKESYAKFQQMGFKNNRKIEGIEKKFKIEIFVFIDSILKAS